MSFYGDLFKYKPTGAFSVEIYQRDGNTGLPGTDRLFEAFFLLPPTDYTMDEGAKVTVNKTIGGAWTDDYGNDTKRISINGELYSFYFGSPQREPSGPGGSYIDNAVDSLVGIGQGLVDTVTEDIFGHAGIDEFFMLRYVFSRLREKDPTKSRKERLQDEKALLTAFPGLQKVLNYIESGNDPTNENLVWVYNDYDDGNRYEVVISKFTTRRSKEDPFTVKYSIEMTAVRPFTQELRTFGKLGKGLKETGLSIIRNGLQAFDDAFNALGDLTGVNDLEDALEVSRAAASIPAAIKTTWDSFISSVSGFKDLWQEFADGVKSDYSVLSAGAQTQEELIILVTNQYLAASGIQPEDLANEDAELDDRVMEIYNQLALMREQYVGIQGLDKYGNNAVRIKILEDQDIPALRDTDFNTETSGGGTAEASQNATSNLRYIYYTVESGDSLDKIAHKFYNDYTLQTVIGQVNQLRNIDFHNDALVGKSIKVPLFNAPVLTQTDNNLVYANITQQTKVSERQKQVLGNDIALDSQRGFRADGSGDISIISGMDCLAENLLDRFKFNQGILGPADPGWGFPGIIGRVPTSILPEKVAQFVEEQLDSDPRLLSSYVIISDMDITADVLKVPVRYTPITGSEQIIDVGKVLPGIFV